MEELIYDIGFHKGEDTLFYLLKGYNVVAVDADIELIEEGKSSFKELSLIHISEPTRRS